MKLKENKAVLSEGLLNKIVDNFNTKHRKNKKANAECSLFYFQWYDKKLF
jgi:hypothetical protein